MEEEPLQGYKVNNFEKKNSFGILINIASVPDTHMGRRAGHQHGKRHGDTGWH